MFRDQWSQFFKNYIVVGSKIWCKFMPTGLHLPTVCSLRLSGTSLTATTPQEAVEEPRTKVKISHIDMNSCPVISHGFSAKKYYGVVNVRDNNYLLNDVGSNPSTTADYNINTFPVGGGYTHDVICQVIIDYVVLFIREVIDPVQS